MGIALITNNILSDSGTAVAGLVPTSRTIATTAPLTGGGDLSANRTISIPAATTTVDGYLSAVDWTTFNNKQAAGNYIVSLTGEATGTGPGATAVTLNNASVTGKILTGVNITGGTVLATDTMLTAFGKLQNQINGLIGSTIYQGVWNASTNTPTLTTSVGTKGYYYIVNVAGSTNLNGITDWKVGDWAIYDGSAWQKVDNTDAVSSVNGQTGAVSLTTDNVAQGTTNLYFSNASARAAISLTVTGSSGASSYNNTTGVLNVPTYTLAGLGGQPLATNLTSLAGLTYASTAFVKMTAAGTFALDTNTYLSAATAASTYLPLAGGTLTGALSGTSATFTHLLTGTSALFTSNVTIRPSAGYNAYFQTSGTSVRINYLNDALSVNVGAAFRATDYSFQDGTGSPVFTIASTGAATFSSSVLANSFNIAANGTIASNGFWGTLHTKGAGSYADWSLINSAGNGIIWNPTGTLNMSFGGNVGIGTTSPADKLTIVGTGSYTGISVDTGSTTGGAYISVKQNGVSSGFFGGSGAALGDTSADLALYAEGGKGIRFYTNANATERMRITSDGNVLIGTTMDAGYKLNVSGQVIASAYFESSDKKLKEVFYLQDSNTFGAIQFNWKDKRDIKNHWGYIAQDVAKFIPDAVVKGSDGFLSVDYNQAHTFKIAKVEDEVTLLKKRVAELEQQLNLN